jgi:hypothetical protein
VTSIPAKYLVDIYIYFILNYDLNLTFPSIHLLGLGHFSVS